MAGAPQKGRDLPTAKITVGRLENGSLLDSPVIQYFDSESICNNYMELFTADTSYPSWRPPPPPPLLTKEPLITETENAEFSGLPGWEFPAGQIPRHTRGIRIEQS